MRTLMAGPQAAAPVYEPADVLAGKMSVDLLPQLLVWDGIIQHEGPQLFQHFNRTSACLLGGSQQILITMPGLVVDIRDELVLHVDDGISRLCPGSLQEAEHDGDPFGCSESAQA